MKITLGRYLPVPSPIHELDPRSKLVVFIGLAILSFFSKEIPDFLLLYGFFLVLAYLSNIQIKLYFSSLRSIYVLAAIIMFFQVFFSYGKVLFAYGPIVVTVEGLTNGSIFVLRLILAVLFSSLLSFTTKPLQVAKAIEDIMKKVAFSKKAAVSTGMTLAIAIRFISILSEEAQNVKLAQEARGAGLNRGGFFKRVKAMTAVVIPLIMSSIRKAEELAIAMEVRGYGKIIERTSFKKLDWDFRATIFIITAVLLGTTVLFN